LLVELEHLKIKTTLIGEMFVSVMGEYVLLLLCLSVFYEPQRKSSELVALSSAAVAGAEGQRIDF
jgi:hypothetical protein